MMTSLSQRLIYLRKEKNIPQKDAAAALGVSQALLSHYERGIRECGLTFLAHAADYYDVTTDYLLGRTMEKKPHDPDSQKTDADIRENQIKGSISAAMAKKLIINSINVLFDIVEQCSNKELSTQTAYYFYLSIYKLFRQLYQASQSPEGQLTLPTPQFPEAVDSQLILCQMKLKNILNGDKWSASRHTPIESARLPQLTYDNIQKLYPQYASSLLNVLHHADAISAKRT